MSIKKGLGKGLDSMIPEKVNNRNSNNSKEFENVSRETFIDVSKIEPNRNQPRKNFDEDAILELSESIKQYGVIQPIVVQKKNDNYEIIAGERRWRASRVAGLKKVPVVIKDYSPQEIIEIALIENIQREDLNPIEEAKAYYNLMKEYNLKQDEVADKVSKSRSAITNSMRLLKLEDKVQQMLIDDMISVGHGRALIPIEDNELQYELAMKIFDHKLSVRDTEKLVKNILDEKDNILKSKDEVAVTTEDDFIYKNLEHKIQTIVGTKVTIYKKVKNKGKIEIEYYSDDELERLVELFETIR